MSHATTSCHTTSLFSFLEHCTSVLLGGDDGNGSRAGSRVRPQYSAKAIDRKLTRIDSFDYLRELLTNLVVRLGKRDVFYPAHFLHQLRNPRVSFAACARLFNRGHLTILQRDDRFDAEHSSKESPRTPNAPSAFYILQRIQHSKDARTR